MRIVADCGLNWFSPAPTGPAIPVHIETAKQMITAAKEAGADFVSFTLINQAFVDNVKTYDLTLFNKIQELIISREQLQMLHDIATDKQIGFMLTLTPTTMLADLKSEVTIEIAAEYCDYFKLGFEAGLSPNPTAEVEALLKEVAKRNKFMLIATDFAPLFVHDKRYYLYCVHQRPPSIGTFNFDKACRCHGFDSYYTNNMICDIAFTINRYYSNVFLVKHVVLQKRRDTSQAMLAASRGRVDQRPVDNNISINFKQLKEVIEQVKLADQLSVRRSRI